MKKLTKWTAILLVSLMACVGFISCGDTGGDSGSDSGDDSGTNGGQVTPETPKEQSIVISDALESYKIGESISFVVTFNNFETKPVKVSVYE